MYSSTLCDRYSINYRKAKMLCVWFGFGVGLLVWVFPRNGAQKSARDLGAEKKNAFFSFFPPALGWPLSCSFWASKVCGLLIIVTALVLDVVAAFHFATPTTGMTPLF